MSLRVQLSLVALVILLLPLAGWQFVRVMEGMLRDGQEEALLARGESLASAVSAEGSLPAAESTRVIYARRIGYPVTVDGYAADWDLWLPWAQRFGGESGETPRVRAVFARHDRSLFGLLEVEDPTPTYLTPERGYRDSDHVSFILATSGGEQLLRVATAAPGAVEAGRGANRLRGQWQETGSGYRLEFRLPWSAVESGLGFAVHDAGASASGLAGLTGTPESPAAPLPVVGPDAGRESLLAGLAPEGSRLWLLDARGWVLGRAGSLYRAAATGDEGNGWLRGVVYRYLLAPPLDAPRPRPDVAARLGGREIDSALAGRPGVRWLSSAQENTVLASAAVPVRDDRGRVIGALLLERPTDALLAFTNTAVFRLVGLTLVAYGAATVALLVFASVLSWRIRRLRDAAERALTADGRVRADFPVPKTRDEIGDLGRSFSRLLGELRTHTDYLRTLADKLSHELRTPIAMVRSSLDNLELEPLEGEATRYARRAREGAERMSAIVRAMAEASRMEETVRDAPAERFDLARLLDSQVQAWRELRTDRRFVFRQPDDEVPVQAAPELVSRLLDKLIENAVDFTPEGGEIRVALRRAPGTAKIEVFNEGPPVPDDLQRRLFQSMTSGRKGAGERPHLGLGLYIARLIVEHHGGSISVRNVEGGVVFDVALPVARS